MSYPRFISIEGIDGSGKSTVIDILAKLIEQKGYQVIKTRDPGATGLGLKLREIVLNEEMSSLTELKLFEAIRHDMIDNVIKPNLESGKVIISDRYIDSTIAYQGYGKRLLELVNSSLDDFLFPDKTILLRISLDKSFKRLKGRLLSKNDRFDRKSIEFKKRVIAGYDEISKIYSDRVDVIDACVELDEIEKKLEDWVARYF